MNITINGKPHRLNDGYESCILYGDLLALAGFDRDRNLDVTYIHRDPNGGAGGVVLPGGHVEVKDGMSFDIGSTGQA